MVRLHLARLQGLLLTLFLGAALCLGFPMRALGSHPGEFDPSSQYPRPKEPLDTIVTTAGRKIPVRVRIQSHSKVQFWRPGSRKIESYKNKRIHQVIYGDGRTVTLSPMAVRAIDDSDYRIVILTENEDDVRGLYPKGVITSESRTSSVTREKARLNAETRLKRKAILKGGTYVLIKSRKSVGGYGEVPTYIIEGEVYGKDPGDSNDSTSTDGQDEKPEKAKKSKKH